MTELAPRLEIVSAERKAVELEKLLRASRPGGPSAGIDLLVETGVAEHFLPEVPRLRLEVDEHHRHKDVYRHSLTVLDQAIELEEQYGLERDLRLRLAALLHDIGKPKTRSLLPDGRVAFHHHDSVGAKLARQQAQGTAVPRRRDRRRREADRPAPAVPRVRHGRVDRLGGPPLRDRRGSAAAQAARADQGRLHDAQQGEGAAAGQQLRRARAADRRARQAGGTGQDPARPGRQRDHGAARDRARAAGRQGVHAPARTADRARPARPRPRSSGTAALGPGRRAACRRPGAV